MLSIEQQSVFVGIIDGIISGYRPRTLANTEVVADSSITTTTHHPPTTIRQFSCPMPLPPPTSTYERLNFPAKHGFGSKDQEIHLKNLRGRL